MDTFSGWNSSALSPVDSEDLPLNERRDVHLFDNHHFAPQIPDRTEKWETLVEKLVEENVKTHHMVNTLVEANERDQNTIKELGGFIKKLANTMVKSYRLDKARSNNRAVPYLPILNRRRIEEEITTSDDEDENDDKASTTMVPYNNIAHHGAAQVTITSTPEPTIAQKQQLAIQGPPSNIRTWSSVICIKNNASLSTVDESNPVYEKYRQTCLFVFRFLAWYNTLEFTNNTTNVVPDGYIGPVCIKRKYSKNVLRGGRPSQDAENLKIKILSDPMGHYRINMPMLSRLIFNITDIKITQTAISESISCYLQGFDVNARVKCSYSKTDSSVAAELRGNPWFPVIGRKSKVNAICSVEVLDDIIANVRCLVPKFLNEGGTDENTDGALWSWSLAGNRTEPNNPIIQNKKVLAEYIKKDVIPLESLFNFDIGEESLDIDLFMKSCMNDVNNSNTID